jgi:hypothetical protein
MFGFSFPFFVNLEAAWLHTTGCHRHTEGCHIYYRCCLIDSSTLAATTFAM